MPKFTIEHQSNHKPDEAYGKIKEFLSNDQDIRRFDSKLECKFDDSQRSGQLKGSQFKADLRVQDADAGSKVSVTVDLPLMLTPFKGKVQETLQKKLAKYLS
jgi:hypothetical protein